jgi:hypothetical protein
VRVISGDPRKRVLKAVAGDLRVGPLARRRILAELADHIDDAVDDLRGTGIPLEEAVEEAVRRLGDARAIADAFAVAHTRAPHWSGLRTRRSLAWIAAAAMSVVTAWAAELPQTSGAKPPAKVPAPMTQRLAPSEHPAVRPPHGRGTTAARRSDRPLAYRVRP